MDPRQMKRMQNRELPTEEEFERMLDEFLPTLEGDYERKYREQMECYQKQIRRAWGGGPRPYGLVWMQTRFF